MAHLPLDEPDGLLSYPIGAGVVALHRGPTDCFVEAIRIHAVREELRALVRVEAMDRPTLGH